MQVQWIRTGRKGRRGVTGWETLEEFRKRAGGWGAGDGGADVTDHDGSGEEGSVGGETAG